MQYSYPNVAMLDTPTVAVLNNGNIFVQMQTVVEEDAADYDYKWMGMKIDLVSQIIDYKTGKVDEKDLKVEDMSVLRSSYVDDEKVEHIFSYGKFFQLMFYAYVYIKMKDGKV